LILLEREEMAGSFFVAAYWGARRESETECAARLEACLNKLADVHPAFSGWYKKGATRKAATQEPVDTSFEALVALLLSGRNKTDFGSEVIDDLGFGVSLWNRGSNPSAFRVKCGSFADNPSLKNYFFLELPADTVDTAALYERPCAEKLLETLVESWDPDWATWCSDLLRSGQNTGSTAPVFGWLTYISNTTSDPSAALKSFDGLSITPFRSGFVASLNSNIEETSPEQTAALQESLSYSQ
jgi:hypothetical protein